MQLLRIFAVSFISTIKVEFPRANSSPAPTLEKIRSTKLNLQAFAGTAEPTWAIRVIKATCLIKVDFPAIFGPVINAICSSSAESLQSLGTNACVPASPRLSFFNTASTTGCRPCSISKIS